MANRFEEFSGDGMDARQRALMEMMQRLASDDISDEERGQLVMETTAGFLQSMHAMTHDVTWEIRACLHAMGFHEFGGAIREALITVMGDGISTGIGMDEFRPITADEKEACDLAISGSLWAHGIETELDIAGVLKPLDGNASFRTVMENEVSKFMSEVEETLGESADEPRKGGWW